MKFCVAIDGSDHAHNAFLKAANLCKPGDHVYGLIVIDLVHFMMAAPKLAEEMSTISNMKSEMMNNGKQLAKRYEDLASELNLPSYETLLIEGNPRDVIVTTVHEKKVDILAIGLVGLINNPNISMGSTSTYCIRNCKCDVLLCK
ncbi:hypothetical protein SAMD00019534_118240 [Acytostelium subglobosum LB1]|uniref:hypothetical protein n=1 Tax=Acytostelium subglobosum LB1 TaxID=1410327 RepID=UPI000644B3A9|nr:hypothetical protein SAMD00019534_118240 [Acytostelium subglobosum LB1]GAM28648.1 hypothetical protein SAMD00019534_118240 [Acytostelium subglobosum LB1]|eukprot:XP_012748426.1 hypothetical protein SAMD00019534_118240 [Acytostelium subglobosum LB1]